VSLIDGRAELDSLSIVPQTFTVTEIDGSEIPLTDFSLDAANAILQMKAEYKEVLVSYRVFPLPLDDSESAANIRRERIGDDSIDYIVYTDLNKGDDLFAFDQLVIEGGVGRALSFGNSQDLVVNSNLNLRLSGQLDNGVEIVGALTDENVPFQPEGNTRQIRELDQVFLQFKKDDHQVTLGDYEQRQPESYFLTYNKRLQGINYTGNFDTKNGWKAKSSVSGAVSRGRYTRNEFRGEQGNQGPYKLFGENNESFIIILAGTEQVYINGILQQRGQDRDYIIDYNIGEIEFTARRLITSESRISVEFEYTDQTYSRTFLHAEGDYGNDKFNLHVNLYTEQDNKGDASLADTTINAGSLLTNLGDNISDFFIPSQRPEAYNVNRIQYRMTDSLVSGTNYPDVFVYSNDANASLFNVIYTFVGEGKGDYVVESQLLNGRVFKWLEPIAGIQQGSYTASIRLVPPAQQQMVSLTSSYKINNENSIELETAFSNKDLNTFSSLGNDDNAGGAVRLKWTGRHFLGADSTKNWIRTSADIEFKQSQFRSIERYRPVEFTRDWSLNNSPQDSIGERYSNVLVEYNPGLHSKISYGLSNYNQRGQYSGLINRFNASHNGGPWDLSVGASYLNADRLGLGTSFFRPKFKLARRMDNLGGITIGVQGDENKRRDELDLIGNLDATSLSNRTVMAFVQTQDTSRVQLKLSAGRRWDDEEVNTDFQQIFFSDILQVEGSIKKLRNHNLNYVVSYNNRKITNPLLTAEQDKRSMLGKLNYGGTLFKGLVKTGFNYEIGSGREPKREFSYIEVADGEGVYVWNDYNNNGIQEIGEFEVAAFQDEANFVRFYTTSNEYINADVTRLNQYLQFQPQLLWRNEEGIKGTIARFSMVSNFSIDRKLFETADASIFNPYIFNLGNADLVSSNVRFTNSVLYNKLSNKFRMAYRFRVNDNKNQLLSGFEQREFVEHSIVNDLFLKDKVTLQTTVSLGNQNFAAENYTNKNFNFDRVAVAPRLSWVVNRNLRFAAQYDFSRSQNEAIFGGELATSNAIDGSFTFSKTNIFSLLGGLQYNNIDYNGLPNSPVSFSMLSGLQQGQNILWRANLEREVAKSVKVSLSYDGRQLGALDPVHTGRARISALF